MYASEDDFRKALVVLKRLEAEGIADVLIGGSFGPNAIRIVLPRGLSTVAAAVEDVGMTEREFRVAVRDDIQETLAAAVQSVSPEDFAEGRARSTHPEMGSAVTPEDPDLARRKLAIVVEEFDIRDLRSRRWLKRTSKTDMLFAADWEIVKKLADNEAEAPEGAREIPAAQLRLSAGPPDDPLSVVTGRGATNVVLNMDGAEIDALIRTLRRARQALDNTPGGGQSSERPR